MPISDKFGHFLLQLASHHAIPIVSDSKKLLLIQLQPNNRHTRSSHNNSMFIPHAMSIHVLNDIQ